MPSSLLETAARAGSDACERAFQEPDLEVMAFATGKIRMERLNACEISELAMDQVLGSTTKWNLSGPALQWRLK